MKNKKYFKEIIFSAFLGGLSIGIVLLVGLVIMNNMNDETLIVKGFCLDKEGTINITPYYQLEMYNNIVNCSNKINPIKIAIITDT